jgi:hypothetical protein
VTDFVDLPLVDSHLDLAENVTLFGRDPTVPVAEMRARERRSAGQATVSLPELARGGIAVASATVTAGFLAADVGEDFEPRWRQDRTLSITLDEHLRRQASYVAGIAGWEHVGIGSDLDGGFGLEESPAEIDTIVDLRKVGAVVPVEAREGVLGANWLGFLRSSLPQTA